MTTYSFDLGKLVEMEQQKGQLGKPKIFSSPLQALVYSHIWDEWVKPHLSENANLTLSMAISKDPRELTKEELSYLEEQDEEDYQSDGYDKWDELYNDDNEYDWYNELDSDGC